MLSIQRYFQNHSGEHLSSKVLWDKLATFYDLEALNAHDKELAQQEFTLPEHEFEPIIAEYRLSETSTDNSSVREPSPVSRRRSKTKVSKRTATPEPADASESESTRGRKRNETPAVKRKTRSAAPPPSTATKKKKK